ncbi:NAD-dependent epimerase/dehydratase family protein [uncultured Thiodictyon sp.]|jgi:nucleoside-diphosphate-sugar epimerase|uniref:NAD-dependent epimerase/dehydratase family protein n=1 Tax=uncultured Thiodictyon sp. TaxID=1846217 RepID=UPI0025E58CD7|nr:NAD-dependent epimerase/dehydratase family protein [uncultured Thiodictyon sp.]
MKGMVLVTGASGFIGPGLCRRLQADGWRVRAVMRRRTAGPWDEAVHLDLGREALPPHLLADIDCIFHLAGKAHALAAGPGAEEEYRLANCRSTLDLLAAARSEGVRGFVYFSSVKAMGGGAADAPAPEGPYGRSKLAAERAVLTSGAAPHPVVLRPSLVYGPHPKGYLELLIRAVRAGWFPPLPELGNGRSMIHRDDLAQAAILCAALPRARGRTYVVTDDTPYSTRRIYECILEALGRRTPRWNLPIGLLRLAALGGDGIGRLRGRRLPFDSEVLEKLIGAACYDGTPIRQELGFQSRRTLPDSMAEMVATTRR